MGAFDPTEVRTAYRGSEVWYSAADVLGSLGLSKRAFSRALPPGADGGEVVTDWASYEGEPSQLRTLISEAGVRKLAELTAADHDPAWDDYPQRRADLAGADEDGL